MIRGDKSVAHLQTYRIKTTASRGYDVCFYTLQSSNCNAGGKTAI
jgi:hypothetical protein